MIVAFAAWTWLSVAAPAAVAPQASDPGEAPAAEAIADTLARWRESLELDLPREVVAEGRGRVSAGGDLATNGEAVALVARALFHTESDPAVAAALLDACTPTGATRAYVELERAREAIESDRLDAALRRLYPGPEEGAPVQHAEHPEAWLLYGRAFMRLGEPERAKPLLEGFLDRAPRHREASAALHMLARIALARRDGASATRLLERARELSEWHAYYRVRRLQVRESPDEPLPRLGLGVLWLRAGEPARAAGVLTDLTRRHPDFADGWFQLGEARRALGELDAARAAYDRALEADLEHPLARYNRAVLALLQDRRADARADFELLVAGPHEADRRVLGAHLALARLLRDAGETDASEARYARYRELGGQESMTTR